MSPRPLRSRKVSSPPVISGFKPYGGKKKTGKQNSIFLHLEEYEAVRLCDYEMLNHHEASMLMAVSRPTLTRIYSRARKKIAEAMVKGLQLIIEGGKIYFDSEWFLCNNCRSLFNNPDKQTAIKKCPLCKSRDIVNYEQKDIADEKPALKCREKCLCPDCGHEKPHSFGVPCWEEICPECGGKMVRKKQ
jgi:predicted DNA-binding protein (UPF0251 family)